MDRKQTVARIGEIGLVAVLRGPTAGLTLDTVGALVAAGVRGIEITYATPDAPGVVRALAERYGDGPRRDGGRVHADGGGTVASPRLRRSERGASWRRPRS